MEEEFIVQIRQMNLTYKPYNIRLSVTEIEFLLVMFSESIHSAV